MLDVSLTELLSGIVLGILFAIPLWRILGRIGLPRWMALLAMVPVFGLLIVLVLQWVVAFRRWPGDDIAQRFS